MRFTPFFCSTGCGIVGIVKIVMNQVKVLQKLTGGERLEQAFMLSEFVRELAVADIKTRLGPRATKKGIAVALRRRLHQDKN